jgi:hypothetical protein
MKFEFMIIFLSRVMLAFIMEDNKIVIIKNSFYNMYMAQKPGNDVFWLVPGD